MKLFILAVAGVAVLLASAGCGGSASGDSSKLTREQYNQVSVGMTAEQVKSIAGAPVKTETSSMPAGHSMGGSVMTTTMNYEYWYYQGDRGWVRLQLTNGKVDAKSGY